MTLVIMAAGMGSRYGGLKQAEPIGPSGEFILDYSIYDAMQVGFDKVVFVIKEENYDLFVDTVGKRIADKIEVHYAFQKLEDIPSGVVMPIDRKKPWGTTQAVLSTKDIVNEPFAVINADDFYGKDAFVKLANFLKEENNNTCAMVGYQLDQTLSDSGPVTRGICQVEKGMLKEIIETQGVEKKGDAIVDKDGKNYPHTTIANMNCFAFYPTIYPLLEEAFHRFFETNKDDLSKVESYIPVVLQDLVKAGKTKTQVLQTSSKWHGVTYHEDRINIVKDIKDMINDGLYTSNLWQ